MMLPNSKFDAEPDTPPPDSHDVARDAALEMGAAKFDVLRAWVAWALVPDAVRLATDGAYTDDLIDLAAADCTFTPTTLEIKGMLLLSHRYKPTLGTARLDNWLVNAAYRGIPGRGPERAAFDNLVAALGA